MSSTNTTFFGRPFFLGGGKNFRARAQGMAQGRFHRSGLKSLLNPPASAFPHKGKRERGNQIPCAAG